MPGTVLPANSLNLITITLLGAIIILIAPMGKLNHRAVAQNHTAGRTIKV